MSFSDGDKSLCQSGYEDTGELHPACEFDHSEIDRRNGWTEPTPEGWTELEKDPEEFTIEEFATIMRGLPVVFRWIRQSGMTNMNGVAIRAILMMWHSLPELHHYSLTEMAAMYGLKKQSLGRWADQFKIDFPTFKSPHMKHE